MARQQSGGGANPPPPPPPKRKEKKEKRSLSETLLLLLPSESFVLHVQLTAPLARQIERLRGHVGGRRGGGQGDRGGGGVDRLQQDGDVCQSGVSRAENLIDKQQELIR